MAIYTSDSNFSQYLTIRIKITVASSYFSLKTMGPIYQHSNSSRKRSLLIETIPLKIFIEKIERSYVMTVGK